MTIPSELLARAESWIAGDPDPKTRHELEQLITSGNVDVLTERMAGTLAFGTAGLRGQVEGGSNRMNRAVVIRATAGVAAYLDMQSEDEPVVVGRDARLSSEQFMEDTIGVLLAAGRSVVYFPDPVPTPLVAHAALRRNAAAAIVITASHNPPLDNGYKVYAANGAQIIPPVDIYIADAIAAVGAANEVPRVDDPTAAEAATAVETGFFDIYMADLDAFRPSPGPAADPTIVYTPLHGVGGRYVVEALHRSGYAKVHPVPEQYQPDGHFPTVSFPNPEEPGALDLAMQLASAVDADVIVANDPDTDRLAAAIPRGDGGWQQLTGNQIGVLLADHILRTTTVERPIVLSSIVSTPMLRSVAEAYEAGYATTLTGFKWIWNAALDLQTADRGEYVFGFEEALGYSVGPAVRDKDGISATVHFVDLLAQTLASGAGIRGRLHELAERHGLWVSVQRSVVRPGTEGAVEIAAAMERLAAAPPTTVGGVSVTEMTDFSVGAETRPRYLAATPLVDLDLGHLGRVLVRPSGTEPKLKLYVDLTTSLDGRELPHVERALLAEAASVAEEVVDYLRL